MSTLITGGRLRIADVGPLAHCLLEHGLTRVNGHESWHTIRDFSSYVGVLFDRNNKQQHLEAYLDARLDGDSMDDLETRLRCCGLSFRLTLEDEGQSHTWDDCDVYHPGMGSPKSCVFCNEDGSVFLNSLDIRRLMKKPNQLKELVDDLERDIPAIEIR